MFCFRRRASESAARDSVVMDVIPLDLDWIWTDKQPTRGVQSATIDDTNVTFSVICMKYHNML